MVKTKIHWQINLSSGVSQWGCLFKFAYIKDLRITIGWRVLWFCFFFWTLSSKVNLLIPVFMNTGFMPYHFIGHLKDNWVDDTYRELMSSKYYSSHCLWMIFSRAYHLSFYFVPGSINCIYIAFFWIPFICLFS